jgi:galactose mutarotase-like enzyme
VASATARKPTAVLVVVAWSEGAPARLVARITYTLDATHPHRVTVTASGQEEIAATVGHWLETVAAGRTHGDAPVTQQ